jgi:precorrin-6B methylase 2
MTAIAESNYTFRAARDLKSRIRDASTILDESASTAGSDVTEKIAAEFVLAMARDSARFRGIRDNQSAFVREAVELLVGAAKKAASDLQYTKMYAEAAASRTDDEIEFLEASRARAAQRWRDA